MPAPTLILRGELGWPCPTAEPWEAVAASNRQPEVLLEACSMASIIKSRSSPLLGRSQGQNSGYVALAAAGHPQQMRRSMVP